MTSFGASGRRKIAVLHVATVSGIGTGSDRLWRSREVAVAAAVSWWRARSRIGSTAERESEYPSRIISVSSRARSSDSTPIARASASIPPGTGTSSVMSIGAARPVRDVIDAAITTTTRHAKRAPPCDRSHDSCQKMAKLTTMVTMTATGTPCIRAGVNSHCRTASIAARSSAGIERITVTSRTLPSMPIVA